MSGNPLPLCFSSGLQGGTGSACFYVDLFWSATCRYSDSELTQDLADAVTVLGDFVQPPLHVDEGLGVGHVVHDDDAVCVSVVSVDG